MDAHSQILQSTFLTSSTISALLQARRSDNPALFAPNRRPLTFAGLCDQVERTVAAMNRLGIGHNDRVALVLRNGPELASAFLGFAAGASAAPLNPAYLESDFHYFLSGLGTKALFVERNSESPAIAVAKSLKIPVLELVWSTDDPAGAFSIAGNPVGPAKTDGFAGAEDIALVLHTSGTTASPKMVPLSQRNLTASAGHIAQILKLSPEDRCLNIMPLFHIHGLVAGVLSSLAAGGSVFCTPGFNVLEFFRWLSEARPTWYTAVPTMHQAVLAHADRNRATLDQIHLRFIRSSSAALPPAVLQKLEQTFSTPVIESYGMTEAAHQMASNPLPPAVRKPGTVGLAAGPEIAIMDVNHGMCPAGTPGEVVIRGPNVSAGYANNPEANAVAFTDGWFHTGDQGVLDEDGYLTITGRLKEIINRGGQKISPREIDDSLMEHPDVSAAAAFPFKHPTLGEEIAAVVVPKRGSTLTEVDVVRFLCGRLAAYKVPRKIVFADDIPKSATGKIQRHELAAAFGLSAAVDAMRASKHSDNRTPTPLEAKLKVLWGEVLGFGLGNAAGLDENFSMLGGDSLQAVELLMLIKQELGYSLPQSVLIESGTVAGMAAYIEMDLVPDCVVSIQTKGSLPPFFCVHGADGGVFSMLHLARHLGDDQPFYGIQCVGLDGKQIPLARIEDMAARYIRDIRKVQPTGPYYLGGYSMGGMVAYEMTQQLKVEGESVALLALIDAYSGSENLAQRMRRHWTQLAKVRFTEMGGYLAQRLAQRWRNATSMVAQRVRRRLLEARWWLYDFGGGKTPIALSPQSMGEINGMAARAYRMRPCKCDAVLFKGELGPFDHPHMHDGWMESIRGQLETRPIDGSHLEVLSEPHVRVLATELADCIKRRHPIRPA